MNIFQKRIKFRTCAHFAKFCTFVKNKNKLIIIIIKKMRNSKKKKERKNRKTKKGRNGICGTRASLPNRPSVSVDRFDCMCGAPRI